MRLNYLSTFFCYFYVSLIFGVTASPQLFNNEIMTSLRQITRKELNSNEIYLSEGDLLELECSGLNNVTFIHPQYHYKIPQSHLEIKHQYIPNSHKAIAKRKKTVYGDSGWYGCVDLEKFRSSKASLIGLSPENFKEVDVQWVYVYVKSNRQAFHGNIGTYANLYEVIGDDVVLPCKVNSPDYGVVCCHDDTRINIDGRRISYDPKKGLVIRNVTIEDSGYYQCYDNVYYHTVSYMLHITKKLADLYNPVISKPEEDELFLGEQIRLNCTAEFPNHNPYSFYWKIPHQSNRVTINEYELEGDINARVLVHEVIIDKANSSDQGEYVCTASSDQKTNSARINIQLQKPPLVNCSSKRDLVRAIAGLKDALLQEMKSGIEALIVNAVEQSVSKNLEVQLASIKSKLDQYLLT